MESLVCLAHELSMFTLAGFYSSSRESLVSAWLLLIKLSLVYDHNHIALALVSTS